MTTDTSRDVFAYEPDPNGGSLPPHVPPLATPDSTPQPPDHGAAGFCTGCAQAPDERTETVAREKDVLARARASFYRECRPMPPGEMCCHGWDSAVDEVKVKHIVAALGDESARLRGESQRFYENRNLWQKRAESADAEHDAARAALDRARALATDGNRHWAIPAGWAVPDDGSGDTATMVRLFDLWAALDPEEPR